MSTEPRRNSPCPCGSDLKYKHCCEGKKTASWSYVTIALVVLSLTLGLLAIGASLSQSGDQPNCPPGQEWSEAHGHCH